MGRERTKMGFKRVTRNLLKLHSNFIPVQLVVLPLRY